MCTVTFYKGEGKVIITSNRDEHVKRPLAIPPQKIITKNGWLYAPIDPVSNGTWFGVTNQGNVIVLLNGASHKHEQNPPYRKSRGSILWELLNRASDLEEDWSSISLVDIEPFTLVAYIDTCLMQLRWDGKMKSRTLLDEGQHHIWSSATLYDPKVTAVRKSWFDHFIQQRTEAIEENDILYFHTNTRRGDAENGLVINRAQTMLTKNITQCICTKKAMTIRHFNLINGKHASLNDELS
ncbi:MAG: NRDE family protein [Bacteroidota bacterium]